MTAMDHSQRLRRAMAALDEMKAKLDAAVRPNAEPIAIIGMGCRLPGGIEDVDGFWQLLDQGREAIGEVPPDRWDIEAFYHPDKDAPGRMYSRFGHFLDRIDGFDPQFFAISPREAANLDPQQRILLEVAWEALENAALSPERLYNSRTGVYVGISCFDFALRRLASPQSYGRIDAYLSSGSSLSVAAGRLSYVLGLQGPCLSVDTLCSSSLVSVHLACQALRLGECDVALAGGVNVLTSPAASINFSRARMLSEDGRCKTFDAAADGYGRGEGCGMVVCKRLSDAQADGDHIWAVIRGSAVNHDGPSGGLTVPNGPAQQAVIRRALDLGAVRPGEVDYVECHGTGTPLGDPIEAGALGAVYGGTGRTLTIGSVKTNIGHLEAAAGIAGLIKSVLSLAHERIPQHLHFRAGNPRIPFRDLGVRVAEASIPWPRGARRRLAGISSFGMSGTNAHVVVEEAPALPPRAASAPVQVFTLSARTAPALAALAGRMARAVAGKDLAAACWSVNSGRMPFRHRLAVAADGTVELAARLAAFAGGAIDPRVAVGEAKAAPKVTLLGGSAREREFWQGLVTVADGPGAVVLCLGHDRPADLGVRWIGVTEGDWPSRAVAVAQLHAAGAEIRWQGWNECPPPKIPLPAAVFERDSFPLDPPDGMDLPAAGEAPPRFTLRLAEPWLAEHKVLGRPVAPLAAVLDLMLAAGRVLYRAGPLAVHDFVLTRAVPSPGEVVVEARAEPVEPAGFAIALHVPGEETAFASARVAEARGAPPQGIAPAEMEPVGDVEAYYRRFAEFGISYGPALRALSALAPGESVAQARLSLPVAASGAGATGLHPILLDAAIQAIGAALPQSWPRRLLLPTSARVLNVWGDLGREAICHIRLASDSAPDRVSAQLVLESERGSAVLDGLLLLPAEGPESAVSVADGISDVAAALAQVAAQVLRLDPQRMDPDQPLSAMGLDSLLAVELRNRARTEAGVELPLAALLGGASLSDLQAAHAAPVSEMPVSEMAEGEL